VGRCLSHSCCCNKLLDTEWFIKKRKEINFLLVLEAGTAYICMLVDTVPSEISVSTSKMVPLMQKAQRAKGIERANIPSLVLFIRQ
jgi:hypothetical protein